VIERLLTARELAELLGVSGDCLGLVRGRSVPGFKLGRSVRFRASEVGAWLKERRRDESSVEAQRASPPSPFRTTQQPNLHEHSPDLRKETRKLMFGFSGSALGPGGEREL
jgi:excisionase family DNA binding protein